MTPLTFTKCYQIKNISKLILFITFFSFQMLQLSCSKNNFPKYSALDRLRILGITTPTPELQNPSSGTTNVSITPYISDIGGSGDITLEVQSCLDPGVSLGATPSCSQAQYASSVQTITMSSASTATEGLFGNPERTGSPQSGAITVPLQIPSQLLPLLPSYMQYNGVSYLITVKATASSGSISSFRRIVISTKTPNNNPTISDLLLNNLSFTQRPTEGVYQLKLSTTDTPESYQFLTGNGDYKNLQEDYEISWFVSEGIMEVSRGFLSDDLDWSVTTPSLSPPQKTVVVAVLRDGRGGTAVRVKVLNP